MTKCAVRDIINDTLELCSKKFEIKKIELVIECEQNIFIKCRPSEISQVLLNLLNNSIDAIENLDKRWIKIKSIVDAGHVEISVTDSGGRIPAENQDKLMQPFFTTKAIGKGTGLGLSVSRGIILSHGGQFFLDTNCMNTRFVIHLPKSV